jgi:asparagine synthase (glutamine-hydrolysing)
MDRVLDHRGSLGRAARAAPQGTLGYRIRFAEAEQARAGAGLHENGDQAIALAGYLISEHGPRPRLEDLLEWYRAEGPTFVGKLRGAFVLAVRDGDTLHLARDGAGVRTLFYARHGRRFLFASEPKGILQAPGFPRRIRPAALAQYLTFSFIPGAGTMLEDVFELPAGHIVTSTGDSRPYLRRYFAFEDVEGEADPSDDHWIEGFRQALGAAVAVRLPEGEPVAVTLSGGIDSSVVTAEVARRHRASVKTYAIHFGKRYPHELDFARAVARRWRTDHEEVLIRPRRFLPRLRRMIWYLDEPIGDPITMPNYELAAHISKEARWVFNGEGGDPCFGGPKNIPMLLQHWYGGVDHGPGFRERAYLASYRRCYEEVSRLLTPEWRARVDAQADLEAVLRPFFEARRPRSFLHKLLAINIRLKGAHLILPKVERMTAPWNLTPFAPLFDEELVKLSFRMPGRMKLAAGVEKVILKRAYARDLPAEVIERPKSGMRVPVHFWFQGELKRYARKILSARELRRVGIFDERRVRQLLRYDTEEGPGRYGLRLWMLLTFELWRRIVVEGETL